MGRERICHRDASGDPVQQILRRDSVGQHIPGMDRPQIAGLSVLIQHRLPYCPGKIWDARPDICLNGIGHSAVHRLFRILRPLLLIRQACLIYILPILPRGQMIFRFQIGNIHPRRVEVALLCFRLAECPDREAEIICFPVDSRIAEISAVLRQHGVGRCPRRNNRLDAPCR